MGKVLTIGEAMGMFIANNEGELKHNREYTLFAAGAEMNVSIGLSRLKHDVTYITQLGKDPFGEFIYNFLEKEGINTSLVKMTSDHSTGFQIKSRDNINDPEVVYFRKDSAASNLNSQIIESIEFNKFDVLHLTGIFMALSTETYELTRALIDKARQANIVITFDPNLRPVLWNSDKEMIDGINRIASKVDYVLPGLEEGRILTSIKDKKDIVDFYIKKGVKGVIIKDSHNGAYAKWWEDDQLEELYSFAFPVPKKVDTVGAGDGFAVGVISGIIEKLSMEDTLERANAIGAIQVSHISDDENLPIHEELADFISNRRMIRGESR